jgi:hypothetical protein
MLISGSDLSDDVDRLSLCAAAYSAEPEQF